MLPRTYDNQVCSVARTLEVIGDRWTMLVIRDAFHGVRRFEEFQERLGVARNVLSARLARLVERRACSKSASTRTARPASSTGSRTRAWTSSP